MLSVESDLKAEKPSLNAILAFGSFGQIYGYISLYSSPISLVILIRVKNLVAKS